MSLFQDSFILFHSFITWYDDGGFSEQKRMGEGTFKLKLQYFGRLMPRANPLGKTLMLGRIDGRREGSNRGWDGWMESPTQWTWVWANSGRWWRTEEAGVLQTMCLQRVWHNLAAGQLYSNIFSYAHPKSLGLSSPVLWVSGQWGSWPPLIKMNLANLEVLALFLLWRTSLFSFFLFI